MPRRKSTEEKTYVVLSPTNINKRSSSISTSYVYSPSTNLSTETVTDRKYAPQRIINRNYAYKLDSDYSPSVSSYVDYDYEPKKSTSESFRTKYAPSFKTKTSLTYAPQTDDNLIYKPELHSVFKPQFVFVSNYQTLKDYYAYLLQLLSLLR
jgi:hypothetical protein